MTPILYCDAALRLAGGSLTLSGKHPLPKLGARVMITFNDRGPGTVTGYYEHAGWIHVKVALDYLARINRDFVAELEATGCEMRPEPDLLEPVLNAERILALFDFCEQNHGDVSNRKALTNVAALELIWLNWCNPSRSYYQFDRSNLLQQCRNEGMRPFLHLIPFSRMAKIKKTGAGWEWHDVKKRLQSLVDRTRPKKT